VILAIGQENAFPWIEKGVGIEFDQWNVPKVDKLTFQSTLPQVFSAAMRPSGRRTSSGRWNTAIKPRFRSTGSARMNHRGAHAASLTLSSRKMGMHEWAYKNEYNSVERRLVPHVAW